MATLADIENLPNGARFHRADLRRLPVPLPPKPSIARFEQRVGDIRAIEERQAASRRRLDELFQALLNQSFGG